MKKEQDNKTSKDGGNTVKVNFTKKSQTQSKSYKPQDIIAALLGGTVEDGEKKPKKRPYLHFKEFGLVIPFWAIVSVEKNEQMRTVHNRLHWMYEIIINRGIESSPNMPFGEKTLGYEKEEIRDAKFDALIKTLAEHNYELNEI